MSIDMPQAAGRRALPGDLDEITRILTSAFLEDPVWGPSFPDRATRPQVASRYWRFMAEQALRFPASRVLGGVPESGAGVAASQPGAPLRAVSVWFPPGEDEISSEALPAYAALVEELLDAEAADALERAGAQFAAARPDRPHAYLTLLGVAPEARGGGYGMTLLRAALAEYDAAGIPTYLESSNPVNDARYERLGYRAHAVVELASGARVQTYLREPQPEAGRPVVR